MTEADATPSERTKKRWPLGCLGIVVGLVVVVFVIPTIASNVQEQQWAERSGTQSVQLTGALTGAGFEIDNVGTLKTNAEYSETSFIVDISRIGDEARNTPMVTVVVGDNRCETPRSYIWSTAQGSTLEFLCDYYMTLDDIRAVESARVAG